MSDSPQNLILLEKGCRRSKLERRMFSYSAHLPERRSGKDRRHVKTTETKAQKRAGVIAKAPGSHKENS